VTRSKAALLSLLLAIALPACSKSSDVLTTEAETEESVAGSAPVEDVLTAEQAELIGRGEAIAETACAGCHAVGAADESPHPDAPPLRLLSQTVDLNTLEARFADGSVSDHPDMPDWQFEQIDAAGLIAYLKSVQSGSAD
jgi:mono/diheme cytochrome c family protein